MGDHEMHVLSIENNPESEVEEIEIVSRQSCCSSDPICVFSRQAKHKSESEDRSKSGRKLCGLIVFCLIFILVEIVGGIKANSLAVLADAGHLFTDVVGFVVSLFTVWASGWEATPTHSFGYFRLEALGALFSVQLIWLISGILIYEAIDRMMNKTVVVKGNLMFFTAMFGIIINLMMVKWLGHGHGHTHHSCGSEDHSHGSEGHNHGSDDYSHRSEDHNHGSDDHSHRSEDHRHVTSDRDAEKANLIPGPADEHQCEIGHHHVQEKTNQNWFNLVLNDLRQKHLNMNIQGAYLHILGDLIQSIGVMIGGAIIWEKPDWLVVDLICTLGFTVLVLFTTIGMLRNLFAILTESTPNGINVVALEAGLRGIKGVHAVHDLHVWSMSVGKILLSCHVIAEQGANLKEILMNSREYCERTYGIHHVTVQIEQ